MTYNADKTWADLSGQAGSIGRQVISIIDGGLNAYDEWQSFRAGRTNAQIATALGRLEAEVADMDSCFAAFKTAHDAMNNTAITTGDYYFAIRKFT